MTEEAARALDRARAVRGAHRGVTTKLVREVEELLRRVEPLEASQRSRLNVINQQLESKLNTLSDMDKDILSRCEIEAIDAEIEESEAVVAKIINCKQQIEEATHVRRRTEPPVQTGPITSPTATPKPRLPKLALPKFKGDVKDWTAFWDSFKAAIHENEDIPKVDKFNYLNSLLEGAAFRTIQGLTLTTANYDSAIALLHERFGNPQQIISAHMEGLLKISNCGGDRSTSLRVVFDKIMVHIRGLEALGVTSAQYGSLLIPVIMTKFPNDVRLRIARETGREAWRIDDLLKIVRQEVEAREASEGAAVNPAKASVQSTRNSSFNSTASSLVTNNHKLQCVYCDGEHFSASCPKITTVKDRRDILLRSGRCFNCLKTRHKSRECDSLRNCRYCHKRHHQSICDQSPALKKTSDDADKTKSTTASASSKASRGRKVILLQTARAVAINGTERASIRILLDSGSQLSYVTKDLQERLRLKTIRKERLHLNTFGNSSFDARSCDIVRFQIQKANGNEILNVTAYTSPVICSSLPTLVSPQEYEHLEGLELADSDYHDSYDPIDVLIGSDHYWGIVTGDTVIGNHGPVALSSKLGWLLSGPLDCHSDAAFTHSHVIINSDFNDPLLSNETDILISMLRQFWNTESIGVLEDDPNNATPAFLNQLQFNQIRYEVGLPWKEDHPEIPDHYAICMNRLRYLQHKLLKSPELLQRYDSIIQDQLKQGIIEPVMEGAASLLKTNNIVNTNRMVHYLPHHCVIRQDKQTTKLRIVYDGSAKTKTDSISLNDCLETGPNLIPKLFDVLITFRWHLVAVTADIEKAFLMIGIRPSDRDMLRFLWLKNPCNVESDALELRFTRLVFGLRPSPAILGSVISHHLDKYQSNHPEIIPSIRKSFYVDDLISGGNTVEEALRMYEVAKQAMLEGGFNLRKWNSNSPKLLSRIASSSGQPVSDLVTSDNEHGGEEAPSHFIVSGEKQSTDQCKLLGTMWNSVSDEFTFCFSELIDLVGKLPKSRRSLLKVTASIFDPLGLLSPFVIKLKLLFQTLCHRRVGWDEPLADRSLKQWNELMSEFTVLQQIRIPRCYFDDDMVPDLIECHGFSDASEHAYAAVLYLRTIDKRGKIVTRLVASKTRVAPTTKQSIPRLELLGALILARLINTILTNCPKKPSVTCWVDSMTTLFWIKNDKPWKQYVSRRVHEIRMITSKDHWNYCPGSLNPADLPSRGLDANKLLNSNLWWEGPSFLRMSDQHWPSQGELVSDDVALKELVKTPHQETHVLTAIMESVAVNLMNIIDCEKFSNLKFLLRVTARVLRFAEIIQGRPLKNFEICFSSPEIEATELNRAEVLWIRSIQSQSFEGEIKYLKNNSRQVKSPFIDQFRLFIDDQGLLKCKGRINNAGLSATEKNPVLLPSKHPFVKMLVTDVHHRMKHGGVNSTLVALRGHYWILRGRQVVKSIIRSCVICKKLEGPPYCSQPSPDLPTCRVSDDPPFSHTGLDFAGPIYFSELNNGGSLSKGYICLFTCASTRAIHLELTRTMNVDAFLLAFRRFAGRRGLPVTLLSDNAKTFKSSSKEIRSICRSPEVFRYLADQRTSWKFIVARAPWWGGFWERMVRNVKRCLKKVVGRTTLKFEELLTLLIEIESVINSQPLTFIYDDQEGVSYTLTPAHLIYGRRLATSPSASHFEVVSTNKTLTRRSKNHRHLLTQLTNCWRKDYLLSLLEFRGTKLKGQGPSVKVGDIVILKDDSVKRIFWKLAKVIELLHDSDGVARAALVNVSNENGPPKVLKRSIRHLIPIEACDDIPVDDGDEKATVNRETPTDDCQQTLSLKAADSTTADDDSVRPRRQAAILGEAIRRSWTGL